MNVKPFDAYKKYVALKLHFNSEKYDYFKLNGAVKIKLETFNKRNDKYKFQKLAKIHTPETLEKIIVANLLSNKDLWVGDLLTPEARQRLAERQKIEQSLTYFFSEDVKFLLSKAEEGEKIFVGKGKLGLVKHAMQGSINLESFIILTDILKLMPKLEKSLSDDITWQDFKMTATKYKPFLKYDKEKLKDILKKCLP